MNRQIDGWIDEWIVTGRIDGRSDLFMDVGLTYFVE